MFTTGGAHSRSVETPIFTRVSAVASIASKEQRQIEGAVCSQDVRTVGERELDRIIINRRSLHEGRVNWSFAFPLLSWDTAHIKELADRGSNKKNGRARYPLD